MSRLQHACHCRNTVLAAILGLFVSAVAFAQGSPGQDGITIVDCHECVRSYNDSCGGNGPNPVCVAYAGSECPTAVAKKIWPNLNDFCKPEPSSECHNQTVDADQICAFVTYYEDAPCSILADCPPDMIIRHTTCVFTNSGCVTSGN